MSESISILLGAGFSVPMGYPSGATLNKLLVNCNGDDFGFGTGGELITTMDGKKPDIGYKTTYDYQFDFCKELIKYFHETRGYFDYEKFYDFIYEEAINDKNVEKIAKPFLNEFDTVDQFIDNLNSIYAQLIAYYLKDINGESYYDNASYMMGMHFHGYTGILNCLYKLSQQNIIHVHTLNHDLFFERLNNTDWLKAQLCDGFEELGSPYYGKLIANDRAYHARLERYTGKYDKIFRLYKLHGSLDYGVYYGTHAAIATPENYLKTRYGIGFHDLKKEIKNDKEELEYEHSWISYHADFLKGTTSKIERYKEPLLYKTLFELFRQNLKEAKMLLIIGYGGKDTEINKMLLENFDFKNKPSYIIDPFPEKPLIELASKLNSTIIKKELNIVALDDIGILT